MRRRSTRLPSLLRAASTVAVSVALFLWAFAASAYPWMIRHDYAGCPQCHADPSGGSLLTEYGRAQGELLLRTQYGKAVEEPGLIADFLGFVPLPSPLLLGGDVREAAIDVLAAGQPAQTDVFLMQGDVEGQVSVGRFRANGSIGFAQEGAYAASITKRIDDNLVSRVHWLGVDLGEDRSFTVRAGRLNVPFGLRSVEHDAWTRVYTRTDSNQDQEYGAAFAWNVPSWRGEVMAIAGNFLESPDRFRERGYSGYAEWNGVPKLAVGVSSLIVHASAGVDITDGSSPNGTPLPADLIRQAHGVFARYTPVKPLVLSLEADLLFDSQPPTKTAAARNAPGIVSQLQADVEVIQGVHLDAIGEIVDKESDLAGPAGGPTQPWFRGWGFVNWFFAPHADIRLDAVYESDAGIHVTTLVGQLHAFL
jgi:hypothetical protein